jgi:membrane fusion protein, multidrug efflux system
MTMLKLFALIIGLNCYVLAADSPPAKSNSPVSAKPPLGSPVEVIQVKTDTVIEEVSTVGTLRPDESVVIKSEIAGRIQRIEFTEGQKIEAGATLILLDASEYKALLEQNNATLILNKQSYDRIKDLFGKQLTSHQALDEAKSKLDESKAKLAVDKVRLDKMTIRAPFSGILGLREVSQGAYITPGQTLVRLDKLDTMKLDFRIPEVYLSKINNGQTMTITLDSFPGKEFSGKVYAMDLAVDEESRTLLLRAKLPNPNLELQGGLFARVKLVLSQREKALLIPEQAVVPQGGASFVFKAQDGQAILTEIKLGQRRTGDVEVIEGLNANDFVITAGQMKLRPNAPIAIISSQEKK